MRASALAVFLAILAPASFASKAFPPAPRSYVHNEGVVSMESAAAIGGNLRDLERRTGRQFLVALFKSLEGESLEDYSNRLFRAWGIGDAKRNDGLLFCLFLEERSWRVEVGYGLEGALTDLEAGAIAREQGAAHFKRGDFDRGVAAVVEALAARLAGGPPLKKLWSESDPEFWILLAGFILILVLRGRFFGHTTIGRRGYYGGGYSGGGFSGGGGLSGGGGASGRW